MSKGRVISNVTGEESASWFALTLFKQSTTKGINPEGFIHALDSVIKHSLWKEKATTLDEFLHSPYPEGAGISRKLLDHVLKTPFTHQLEEVEREVEDARLRIIEALAPTDSRKGNGQNLKDWDRGDSGAVVRPDSYHHDTNLACKASIAEKRCRAVTRAPRVARELHAKGLIGVQEVVKLGPRTNNDKPTAQQLEARARADEAGARLERWIEANPVPHQDENRPAYKRRVNAVVREFFSEPPLITVRWKANANADAIASALLKKISPDMLPDVIQSLINRSMEDASCKEDT